MTQFCPDPPPKCEISHFFFSFSSETFPNPETFVLKQMSTVSNLKSQYDLGPEIQHFYEILNFGPFDVGHIIREVKGAAPHLALEQLLFSF